MRSRTIRLLVTAGALGLPLAAAAAERPAPAPDAASIRPLVVGARVPAVTVRDAAGEPVDLRQRLTGQRTVLVFYRGGW